MNNVFVYCEMEGKHVADVSLELLTKGRKLATQLGCQLETICAGSDLADVEKQVLPYGVDRVHVFDAPGLFPYTSLPHTSILVNLFKEEKPQICLMGATVIGRDLGPRVSSALTSGLTADCTQLEIGNHEDKKNGVTYENLLYQIRPAFGGNIVATIINPEHRPQMATVREGVMKKEIVDANYQGEVIRHDVAKYVPETDYVVKVIDRHVEKAKHNLKGAPIVIAGGYGMGSKEGFDMLFELALNNLPDTKYEIVQQRGRGGGYYMTEAPFELAELKLLVDAVYASKFITARKSKILIDKLGQFTSTYRQEELDRKVLVSGRIKSTDEKILYTVDALHAAITAGEQVTFKYCDWNLQKRMAPRHDGQLYRVSPWVLVWENGNYYLIAYTEGRLKHYRVDKMQNVHQLPDTTREGAGEYANFDVNTYMQQMFGMFNGPLKRVTLQCENRFAGAMIDRFGTAPILTPCADGEHFTMTAEIQVSPQFFGWVAGFGTGVVVSGPPEVRAEMKKTLDQLQELYR